MIGMEFGRRIHEIAKNG